MSMVKRNDEGVEFPKQLPENKLAHLKYIYNKILGYALR